MEKRIALIFPGQGSQTIGMLNELAAQFGIIEETFAEASEVLHYDLWQLVQQDPLQQLNQTEYTQPALLAAEVAIWRLWQQQQGTKPCLLAGHSVGEYSALVCAQAIDLQQAIMLVRSRGRYMQMAVLEGKGAMAAIVGLVDEQIAELCQLAAQNEVLAAANFNAPGQTVIAGHSNAVERCIDLARSSGAKLAKKLSISIPSHCELMRPAAQQMAVELAKITVKMPEIPIIHNSDTNSYTTENEIKTILLQQLYSPVRWVETIQKIVAAGITTFIECGPGKVLAGLNKRIDNTIVTISVSDVASLSHALEETK